MSEDYPWYRGLARLPGARWIDDDGLVAVVTDSPFAGFNAVLRVDTPAAVERAAALMHRGAWTRWSPGSGPDALDERLLADGYVQRSMTVLEGELAALEFGAAPDDAGWAREARELHLCVDLMAEVFAIPADLCPEFKRVHLALAAGEDPPWRVFALRRWGTVVATCVFAGDGETIEINATSTSPVARGRRWAQDVILAALHHARSAGYRRVVAQTDPGGAVLATRFGLTATGVVRHLHRA